MKMENSVWIMGGKYMGKINYDKLDKLTRLINAIMVCKLGRNCNSCILNKDNYDNLCSRIRNNESRKIAYHVIIDKINEYTDYQNEG